MSATKLRMARARTVLLSALAVVSASGMSAWAGEQPRLVLQITVDALRGDLPGRFNWELLHPSEMYLFGEADDRDYEADLAGFGRIFPHAYGQADDKYLTTKLTLSPAGDELTLDFAKTLMESEQLGQNTVSDFLAISFSSSDYVGHLFGASSLEIENNLARLDRTLAVFVGVKSPSGSIGKPLPEVMGR